MTGLGDRAGDLPIGIITSLTGGNAVTETSLHRGALLAVEQVNAIEAWLKSDQVLAPLLPRLSGYKPATEPGARVGQMRAFRNALSLELVGGSVLQIRLEGSKPKGLGRDLEIILSRLMEGLTGPEQNIFSAPQFVLMQRGDELAAADAALDNAIHASGTNDPAAVIRDLRQLSGMTTGSLPGMRSSGASQVDPQAVEELRRRISNDPSVSRHLEQLYAARQRAQAALDAMRSQAGGRSNYVGIFDAPDNLLVIGRPADPVVGESKGRKLAIAGVLASILLGAALVFAVEFLAGPLRTRKDFEDALGVPVIARVGHLPNGSDAPPAQSA